MTMLRFRSKEQFENFVNEENKAVTGNVTDDTATAPVSLTQEQIRKNSNAFIASYLAKQREQILTARKTSPQKTQPQKGAHVTCRQCKRFTKEGVCTFKGWKVETPDLDRICKHFE